MRTFSYSIEKFHYTKSLKMKNIRHAVTEGTLSACNKAR